VVAATFGGTNAIVMGASDFAVKSLATLTSGTQSFDANATFTINSTGLGGALDAGFLQSTFTNSSGFKKLVLTIDVSTSQVTYNPLTYTFTTLASAQNFFNDTTLTLNSAIPDDSSLQVSFDLDLISTGGGDAFAGDLIFGDPVPEPSSWILLAAGAMLIVISYRRRRMRS
jgi:hypothetical protein